MEQVVLARTAGGAIVGGYNPQGWIGEHHISGVNVLGFKILID